MPSKGSPIVPIRIPPDLLADVERTIARRNLYAFGAPWTRSDFIVTAIREKLSKMARSRSGRAARAEKEVHAGDVDGDTPKEGERQPSYYELPAGRPGRPRKSQS